MRKSAYNLSTALRASRKPKEDQQLPNLNSGNRS